MWSVYDTIMSDLEWSQDDDVCNQAMDQYGQDQSGFVDLYGQAAEEDEDCNQVMEAFERNRKFQSHLIS